MNKYIFILTIMTLYGCSGGSLRKISSERGNNQSYFRVMINPLENILNRNAAQEKLTKESKDLLENVLKDHQIYDGPSISLTLMALKRLNFSEYREEILKFLEHDDWVIRANAINYYESFEYKEAIPYLIKNLYHDKEQVFLSAVKSLRGVKNYNFVEQMLRATISLTKILEREIKEKKSTLIISIAEITETLIYIHEYIKNYETKHEKQKYREYFSKAENIYLKSLNSTNSDLQIISLNFFESFITSNVVLTLIKLLNNKIDEVRLGASSLLWIYIGSGIKMDFLTPELENIIIHTMVSDKNEEVRINLAGVCAHAVENSRSVPALLYLLQEKNANVKVNAMIALSTIENIKLLKKAEELFIIELNNNEFTEHGSVKSIAIKALGMIKSEKSIDLLLNMLNNVNHYIIAILINSLGEIAGRFSPQYNNLVLEKIMNYKDHNNDMVISTLLKSLGKIKDNNSLPFLKMMLTSDSNSTHIKSSAAVALHNFNSLAATEILKLALNDDSEFDHGKGKLSQFVKKLLNK